MNTSGIFKVTNVHKAISQCLEQNWSKIHRLTKPRLKHHQTQYVSLIATNQKAYITNMAPM